MRALITGVSGFVGSHLAECLCAEGAEVWGLSRGLRKVNRAERSGFEICYGDVLDEARLRDLVAEVKPTHIFHLAGAYGPSVTFSALYELHVTGTIHLLNVVRALLLDPWIMLASSSAVYGASKGVITEEGTFQPLTHYATSKVAEEMVGIQYHGAHRLRIVRTRTFNLIGPRQPSSLVASALACQVAAAENGGPRVVKVGNTAPRRDYTDVRDAVRAYALLARQGKPGQVYHVCSEQAHSVQECLEALRAMAKVPLEIEIDPAIVRITEVDEQVGSVKVLFEATGWRPEIPFEASLLDLLEYWRHKTNHWEEQ